MGGVKDHIISLFKNKDYSQPKRVKTVWRWKEAKQIKNTKSIWRQHNRIIRDIKTLFEQQEEECCKLFRVGNF